MNKITITQTMQAPLLIVGSGIAGLSCAVEAEKTGISTVLISKQPLGSGASFFPLKATLGIQVTDKENPQDPQLFEEDIRRVAQGMNNLNIVKIYIEDSAEAVGLLNEIGFQPWKRNDSRPACFAQYPRPIYLIKDWKSAAKKAKQIIAQQQTQVYENATLLHIATENSKVQGAVFSVKNEQKTDYIFCQTPHIILATGGIAGLYKDNLYPADVIGSTHFLALQAGAKLTNLEYIQFIPAFIEPKYKVLFGEHTLKYCTDVQDNNGNSLFPELSQREFAEMVTERSHYAPFSVDFDCVTFDLRIMQYLLQQPNEQGVYLQYSPALYEDKEEFYTVYLDWLKELGINLLQDKIAIAPFAHSCNGGVEIDEFAQTAVEGLFAVGEISSCIEGANRLGGNSVGGSLVFAKRAIQKISEKLTQNAPHFNIENLLKNTEKHLNNLTNNQIDNQLSASQVLSEVRQAMSKYANVYRSAENLQYLQQHLQHLEQQFNPINYLEYQGIEIYNALKTAQLVVQSMLSRQESRGAHYRADFPLKNEFATRIIHSLS